MVLVEHLCFSDEKTNGKRRRLQMSNKTTPYHHHVTNAWNECIPPNRKNPQKPFRLTWPCPAIPFSTDRVRRPGPGRGFRRRSDGLRFPDPGEGPNIPHTSHPLAQREKEQKRDEESSPKRVALRTWMPESQARPTASLVRPRIGGGVFESGSRGLPRRCDPRRRGGDEGANAALRGGFPFRSPLLSVLAFTRHHSTSPHITGTWCHAAPRGDPVMVRPWSPRLERGGCGEPVTFRLGLRGGWRRGLRGGRISMIWKKLGQTAMVLQLECL